MTPQQYNKVYDEIHAAIKGSMTAMSREQKEQVVQETMAAHGLKDEEAKTSLMSHFGGMTL
jgi:hypothetical protein